ncbi:MAG: hypothetical protein RL646_793 [Verrucomicrobiota bacterium]|jgi:sirohydrochlorin ferrochelatase
MRAGFGYRKGMLKKRVLLVDNGSLEPAATLGLRELADQINCTRQDKVLPVSVMHSDKVDPARLGGKPAVIFEQAVRQAEADGIEELVVLPLFIGPSRALTEFIPKVFAENVTGPMRLKVLSTLFDEDGSDLAHILAENLRATGWKKGSGTVLLCDHGSPVKAVTECRNRLAAQLRKELRLKPDELIACSMERREGPEYDFNEPLLERAIQHAKGEAVILMMFLLPGRHAGPDGDVASIAKECAPPGLRWKLSPLIGSHEMLGAMLEMKVDHVPLPKNQVTVAAYAFAAGIFLLPWALHFVLPDWLQHKIVRALISLLILIPALFYWVGRRRKA